MSTQYDAVEQYAWARGNSGAQLAQQDREMRYGVKVGEPSTRDYIAPRPNEGKHVLLSSRTTPTEDWWLLMIKDQTGPGRHRRPHAMEMTAGTVYFCEPVWHRVTDPNVYPDELVTA